jgi:outer membrane protein OmpA-like peptidoglycan-associated protein/tetratricopeptide (TPR) repeat protein
MITKKISLLYILLFSLHSFAQEATKKFEKDYNKAEKYFSNVYKESNDDLLDFSKGDYALALPIFLELYSTDTSNMNLAFKIGVCYQGLLLNRAKALPYFQKASFSVSKNYDGGNFLERNAPLVTYKYLADAYHLNYQFDLAIETYQKYIRIASEHGESQSALVNTSKRKIEMSKTGKKLVSNPTAVKIENLGANINTIYPEYSPVLSADQQTIFFTSRRPGSTGNELDIDGNYYEDIYMSYRDATGWLEAMNIDKPVNTKEHEASVGISPDGQTILIYKDDKGEGNIYSTTLEGEKWSVPVKLSDNINTKHWEPSAFISADGRTIYFTSNRPGGYGGRDLYTSTKQYDGDWGVAVNMGPNINTEFDEDAPFIHPDGVTFYFSSNGHNTMGGFDIFESQLLENNTWAAPTNVGYPINTTDNDIFYVVSPDGKQAYFTSFRLGGQGEKDIYMATFEKPAPRQLALVKGNVVNEIGKPAEKVTITIIDNETEEVIGVYNTNSLSGRFVYVLVPGRNYNITYSAENRLFYSENRQIPKNTNYFEIKENIVLSPIQVGSKIALNNIFFDFDKATLRDLSRVEIKNLIALMNQYPKMKIQISGHTDSKGSEQYNQKLSEDRAKAVVDKLKSNGISPKRLKSKGYGELDPDKSNKMKDGSDNPEGRQMNRRVELIITAM